MDNSNPAEIVYSMYAVAVLMLPSPLVHTVSVKKAHHHNESPGTWLLFPALGSDSYC